MKSRRLASVPARGVFLLGASLHWGCEDGARQGPAPLREAPVESESPSAKIYPAPLQTGVLGDPDGPSTPLVPSGSGGGPGKKAVQTVVRKLPLLGPVEPEVIVDVEAPGYQLDLLVSWPPVQSSVSLRGDKVQLAPTLSLHILPETARHPARLRIELSGGTLPLPEGTELLASSDAEGWLVVWPDHRSYRVVSALALRSILEERRVDRVPVVAVETMSPGVGRLLGRDTRRIQLAGAVGTLSLDVVDLPEVGSAGRLACAFFLALLRADPRPYCADGALPVQARYVWAKEQVLEIGAQRLAPRGDYRTGDFALPPRLGLYKPGELPPLEGHSNLDPAMVWPDSQATSTWIALNHHDVPMYLILDGFPVARLDPHLPRAFRVSPGEHRHAARDWLGQVIEAGGSATGDPGGSSRTDTVARPTVQYGTPPELEVD